MIYTELEPKEVAAGLTDNPAKILLPILEELERYKNRTEIFPVSWNDLPLGEDDGLTLAGYPIHPYVQHRMSHFLLGIKSPYKNIFWEEQTDVYAPALKRAAKIKYGDKVTDVIVTNNQVVAFNFYSTQLDTHYDFILPMIENYLKYQKNTGHLSVLSGYQISPIWTFLRILNVQQSNRRFALGFQMDANFMFNSRLNSRAQFGLFLQDLPSSATLDLQSWWSLKPPKLQRHAKNRTGYFSRKLDKQMKHPDFLNKIISPIVGDVNLLKKRVVDKEWKTQLMINLHRHNMAKAVLDYSGNNKLELLFHISNSMRFQRPLLYRILAERELVKHLTKGHVNSKVVKEENTLG